LPPASANCALTRFTPSPALSVNGSLDAYATYAAADGLDPLASRIRTAPDVAESELETVTCGLFV